MKTSTFSIQSVTLNATTLAKEIKSLNKEIKTLINKIIKIEKSEDHNPNLLKRGKGRPRKIIDLTTIKRGRGRPRKVKSDDKSLALVPFEDKNLGLIPFKDENLTLIPYSPQKKPLDILVWSPAMNRTKDRSATSTTELDAGLYRIKQHTYNWKSFYSLIYYSIISRQELKIELERFLIFYKKEYPKHKFFAIIFKIRFKNGSVRSCSTTQIANINDFEKLLAILSQIFLYENFADKVSEDEREVFEEDSNFPSGNIIFDFKTFLTNTEKKYEGLISLKNKSKKIKEGKEYDKVLFYKGLKIPTHMDIALWPNIVFSPDYKNAHMSYEMVEEGETQFINFVFNITDENIYTTVINKGQVLLTFSDTLNSRAVCPDLTTFTREINEHNKNKTYIYKGGKLSLFLEDKSTKYIEPISSNSLFRYSSIRTLDIETRTIDGKMVPICMSFYDGIINESFLFKDHLNWQTDMENALKKSIMKRAYKDTIIYVHNFSYFDAIFMIDILSKLGTVNCLIRDNKFIQLKFTFFTINEKTGKLNKKPYTITIYDSYLLLPASLDSLGKSFNIENKKSIFPFNFINQKEIDLEYNGRVPDYKYFPKAYTNDFTLEEYNTYCEQYKNRKWKLSRELVYYCERDTTALHQIIKNFGQEIFQMYKIDIIKYPTLPSVAFAIYRSKFLSEDKIPLILSKLHFTLKESYYGGITDIYQPLGWNIHSYDVNSLYPSSMLKYPMPVGKPKFFSGNPFLLNKDPFGFFRVKVSSPLHLKVPILPTKVETKSGIRTICPVGSWSGWYFSEEIKNAEKYGYKFEILEGYLFERDFIFTEYINDLYELKNSVEDNDPRYFIAKLLMNSLYGRFGMNPISQENRIVSAVESERIIMERKNVNVLPLLSGNCLISYDKLEEDELDTANISVIISSAIASYSRIQMSYFMNKYQNNLYAIDTDGIKVDCKLDSSEVDNKQLGKMKYEYTFKEAVFIAPKVYGGLLERPYKKYKTEVTKVKGLKNQISYRGLKTVLNKNNPLKVKQEKWRRRLGESTIIIDLESYTLSITLNKRVIVFNTWGDFIETLPIHLQKGKIISPPFISRHSLPSPTYFISVTFLLVTPFIKERISLQFFQVLSIIKYIKPQPLHPFIIFIIPIHLAPFDVLIPFILHIIPNNLRPFIIFIIPYNILPFIIYVMPLYLVPFIIYIMPLYLITSIIFITPLDLISFTSKSLPIIPFIIYIIPLHLVTYSEWWEVTSQPYSFPSSLILIKKRGRPRKINFFVLPDGIIYLNRSDLPKRPRGRPHKTVIPCLVGNREPP